MSTTHIRLTDAIGIIRRPLVERCPRCDVRKHAGNCGRRILPSGAVVFNGYCRACNAADKQLRRLAVKTGNRL